LRKQSKKLRIQLIKTYTMSQKAQEKSLRLRAGVIIALLTILVRFGIPALIPEAAAVGVLGGLAGGLVTMVWWAFFSGASRMERWGAVVLIIVGLLATSQLIDESISTAMMGMMFPSYALPVLCAVFVIWAVATRKLANNLRWVLMVATILLTCGMWTLIRSDGITGHSVADFAWRWAETAEEKLLATTGSDSEVLPANTLASETKAEWPGFRGPERNGIARGTRISTDWSASPPTELWRQPIGPGCSSFAVHGNLMYTQEQRGKEEVVSCYDLTTGKPVWKHGDPARFWDSHAGAGPRSTPTLSGNLVCTFGATGILNVLNAMDGAVIWSRNAANDTETEIPGWGFASSPLVIGDVVIVAPAGNLVAYDLASGDHLWMNTKGGAGYSSPHLFEIDGVAQVVLMNDFGAISVAPEDGTPLWEYPWPHTDRILQPARTPDGDILLSTGGGKGMRRLKVMNGPDGWSIEERLSAVQLKSFFNDFVVHRDLAYGFTGPFVECVDIVEGGRKWKSGRYGGQLILLVDQNLLVVLTEKGDVALIEATPDKFTELGRFPAIEGKTWNHPVVVGDILLVRNSQEMVAFHLSSITK
jgi:outer membrane protein assembly factor BamB